MTEKEKAKAYDEAIERAKKWYNAPNIDKMPTYGNRIIEEIFPEFKESENERIKTAILNHLKKMWGNNQDDICGVHVEDAIAWLEKQGEYLENYDDAEKEKADFVGDGFIECHADFLDFKEGNTYWLEYIGDDKYNVRSDNLLCKTYHITPCQLYTVFKKLTWLEKQGETSPILSNSSNTGKNKPKFDPKILQPFDKVLVRDDSSECWEVQLFSHIIKDETDYPYECINDSNRYCIPYNDDTKHLVGTYDEAPEFYRYWED